MLDFSKPTQESNIPVKIIKGNIDLFVEVTSKFFNESERKTRFLIA